MVKEKRYRPGEYEALSFRNLPERAQELWFDFYESMVDMGKLENLAFISVCGLDYSLCKSPIEVIFNFAYDLILFSLDRWPIHPTLQPQYKVQSDKRVFYLDFAVIAEDFETKTGVKNLDFKLAIECDGHDFHKSTKEQVQRDNERDYDLKLLGFDVLHFSGSQIYNDPFGCAVKTLQYIKKRVRE